MTTTKNTPPPPTVLPDIPEDMSKELDILAQRLQKRIAQLPIIGPKEITLPSGQKVQHCDDGPCIAWAPDEAEPDGKKAWFISGIEVTEQIVMRPETLTIKQIKEEKNAEVRRIMRERYGNGKYLQETGAKVIDSDFEGARKGSAPRVLLEDDEKQKWLVGTDGSTGRVYYMAVEGNIKTCRTAHESLFGFQESKILAKS